MTLQSGFQILCIRSILPIIRTRIKLQITKNTSHISTTSGYIYSNHPANLENSTITNTPTLDLKQLNQCKNQ